VSIEAKIIFVDRTDVNALGIVYDLKDRTGNSINDVIAVPDPLDPGALTNQTLVDLSGESIAALANANDRILAPSLQILATTAFGDFSLAAFLDALEQHQLSDVQAAPSIQVVDNHNARIQVGEETPIRVLEQGAQQANATVNVQFKDTGIILDVTPHVTNNNQVLLDVSAERSGVQTDLPDVGFNFTQQLGQTRLLLNDGETMVIGGLTLSEVNRNESGIPLLMDIPVLGALFRTTNNREQKQDLIILVTPHIVP
jgi:type IV pilus assembly protein PilQ